MPAKVTDWADGGLDTSLDCVIADASDDYKWKSAACSETAEYLCELSHVPCPEGYEYAHTAGPRSKSCFKIVSGGEYDNNGKWFNSITTAESLCMEDGTRLAAPPKTNNRDFLIDWLKARNPFLRFTGDPEPAGGARDERFWLGFRPFQHSLTKDSSCTSCNFEDQVISPWEAVPYLEADIMPLLQPTSNTFLWTKCMNLRMDVDRVVQERECFSHSDLNFYGICEYRHCETVNDNACIFPFKFSGRSYDTCITLGSTDGTAYCATAVDNNGTLTTSEECHNRCSVSNCPVGFHPHLRSCIRVSALHNNDVVTTVDEAEAHCLAMGSRLFQPRSAKSLRSLYRKNKAISSYKIYNRNNDNLRVILGTNISLDGPSPVPFYRDGTKFPYELIQPSGSWSWGDPGAPNTDDPNNTCIHLSRSLIFANEHCDLGSPVGSYICEARPSEALDQLDEPSGAVCHFPFKKDADDFWRHSCVYDKTVKVSPFVWNLHAL